MRTFGRRAFLAAIALLSPLLRVAGAQTVSLDAFVALSSRLTGRTNLDRDAAGDLLKALLSTPGNEKKLLKPDEAFEREIIIAWYTGMCTVRGVQQSVTHTAALQWRALGMPAPGTCTARFGAWSEPPRA